MSSKMRGTAEVAAPVLLSAYRRLECRLEADANPEAWRLGQLRAARRC